MSDRLPLRSLRFGSRTISRTALAVGLAAATLAGAATMFAAPASAQSMGVPGGVAGMPQGVQMPTGVTQPPAAGAAPPAESAPDTSSAPLASSSSSCQDDINKLAQKRMGNIEQLNKIAKANKGKLDPIAACPKFKSLVAVEKEFEAYMVKNKDWCNIPDEVLENVKQGSARDAAVGKQACDLAAQVVRAKKQQQAGGGLAPAAPPRLPTGPL